MPDLTVPAVLLAVVVLILLGQWIVVRRAQSTRGTPAPDLLFQTCSQLQEAADRPFEEGVVVFESPRCLACQRLAPILVEVMGPRSVPLCSINVQAHPQLARDLRVMGTPTIFMIHQGLIAQVIVGSVSQPKLNKYLDQFWPLSVETTK